MKKRKIVFNENWNPKPITEGEVWQGHWAYPNELRDENEKWMEIKYVDDEEDTPSK